MQVWLNVSNDGNNTVDQRQVMILTRQMYAQHLMRFLNAHVPNLRISVGELDSLRMQKDFLEVARQHKVIGEIVEETVNPIRHPENRSLCDN